MAKFQRRAAANVKLNEGKRSQGSGTQRDTVKTLRISSERWEQKTRWRPALGKTTKFDDDRALVAMGVGEEYKGENEGASAPFYRLK